MYRDASREHKGGGRGRRQSSPGVPWNWILVYLVVVALVVTSGFLLLKYLQANVKDQAQEQLAAIADLKADQIGKWLDERRGDAAVIMESPCFTADAREFLADPTHAERRDGLQAWMESRIRNYDYHSVFLLDAAGEAVLAVCRPQEGVGDYARGLALESMSKGEVAISDLRYGDEAELIHIDLIAPIPSGDEGGFPTAGAVLLRIDPYTYLYPLIQSWPTPSESAETLLVRSEDGEVVFLNELRHREDTALSLRFPAGEEDLIAGMAARGFEGVTEGTDYRGVEVLAAVRKVPGTAWNVIAKVDTAEVYSPVASRAWLTISLTIVLVLALGLLFALAWSRRQGQLYRLQYELEAERGALVKHYDYLTRYANDIVVLMDQEWRIVEVNERAVQAYGYTREELIGIYAPKLRSEAARAGFDKTLRGLDISNGTVFETEHMRKDGSTFPVEVSARLIQVDGNIFYQGIIRDITERKRMEEDLAREREQMLSIFESIDQVIYVSDPDTYEILYVNKALRDLLDNDPTGGICYREFQGFEEPCSFCTNRLIRKMAPEPHVWEYHNPVIDRDFMLTDRMIAWPGRREARFEMGIDITDRKSTERRLKRLNHCFLGLGTDPLENILMIVDAGKEILQAAEMHYSRMDGGRFHIYHTMQESAGFERVKGAYSLLCHTAIAENSAEPIVVEDLPARGYDGFLPEVARGGLGSYLAYPVRAHGVTVGVLGLLRGERGAFASEDRDLMGMLARAVAVEEERLAHEEELRNFIDIASHELRHPMTIIKGYAATMSLYKDRMDETMRRGVLAAIDKGVDRLEKLVYQLLDTARIERKKLVLEKAEMDVVALLEKAVAEMQGREPDRDFAFDLQTQECRAEADVERIVQVLVILMENAVNYSPHDTPVDVELTIPEGGKAVVSVMDRGVGVPEEDHAMIFERFYQVGEAAHHSSEGIGLGLHIAREIIEAHGGEIWYEPREGGGSIFRFTLPCL